MSAPPQNISGYALIYIINIYFFKLYKYFMYSGTNLHYIKNLEITYTKR